MSTSLTQQQGSLNTNRQAAPNKKIAKTIQQNEESVVNYDDL